VGPDRWCVRWGGARGVSACAWGGMQTDFGVPEMTEKQGGGGIMGRSQRRRCTAGRMIEARTVGRGGCVCSNRQIAGHTKEMRGEKNYGENSRTKKKKKKENHGENRSETCFKNRGEGIKAEGGESNEREINDQG